VVIVVVRIDVRVQEGRAHPTTLNGKRQAEGEHAADHVDILHRNRVAGSEEFLNERLSLPRMARR
jgi:hypothetical protein